MNSELLIENPDLIRDVQNVQLEILREFDRICREHSLDYHVFGGTLLGAVRHNGFIPWDDDIDVGMLRKDYTKFIEVAKEDMSSNYFLQTIETDKETQVVFAKMRKNGTVYKEKHVQHLDVHHGIFIDIFPLDNVKTNEYKGIRLKITAFLYKVHIVLHKGEMEINERYRTLKKLMDRMLGNSFSLWLKRCIDSNLAKIGDQSSEYVNHLTNGINKRRYDKFIYDKNLFSDIIELNFEDMKVKAPRNYDEYLKQIYGQYMEIPRKEDRVPHHGIIEVKF